MFDSYKKYLLIRYCTDCGVDYGTDYATKRAALLRASADLRTGWQTVACINTRVPRVEFVRGEDRDIYAWFAPMCAGALRKNTGVAR